MFTISIIMKVGSQKKTDKGFFDMGTDIDLIARRIELITSRQNL